MKLNLDSLSKKDACDLLYLLHESFSCTNEKQFTALIIKLKELMLFDVATCLLRRLDPAAMTQSSLNIVNINYPSEWIELYVTRNYQRIDPIIRKNFRSFALQYWADTYKEDPPPRQFLSLAQDFRLERGYTHGVRTLCGKEGSLFSFAGGAVESCERTRTILNLTVPHLHQAFLRMINFDASRQHANLSPREEEVFKWLKQGKNTWEISTILHIAQRTVHFHVRNIKQKLNASSITHAVAIASESRLTDSL